MKFSIARITCLLIVVSSASVFMIMFSSLNFDVMSPDEIKISRRSLPNNISDFKDSTLIYPGGNDAALNFIDLRVPFLNQSIEEASQDQRRIEFLPAELQKSQQFPLLQNASESDSIKSPNTAVPDIGSLINWLTSWIQVLMHRM